METRRAHKKGRTYQARRANKQWLAACSTFVVGTALAVTNAPVVHADTVTDNAVTKTSQESVTNTDSKPATNTDNDKVTKPDNEKSEQEATEEPADKPAVEEKDSSTVQAAKAAVGQIVDDQSHDYTSYLPGKEQTAKFAKGHVSLNRDVINEKQSAKLVLAGTAEAGETYTVLIPTIYAGRTSLPGLPPGYGTTTIKGDDSSPYFEVIYRFTISTTFGQTFTLTRNPAVELRKVFANATDFYRPFDLISGHIKVIHNTDVADLAISYQLPMIFQGGKGQMQLPTSVANGEDIKLQVPIVLNTLQRASDVFGTTPLSVSDFSLRLKTEPSQKIADWVKLGAQTGTITDNAGHQASCKFSLAEDGNDLIIKVSAVQPLSFSYANANNDWTLTVPLHMQVPASALASADAKIRFTFPDVKIQLNAGQVPFYSQDSGISFDLGQTKGNLKDHIQYKTHLTYQNIDSGYYTTDSGGLKMDSQPNLGVMINGKYHESGYNVEALTNDTGQELQDVHYNLDVPDGLALYSVTYGSSVPDKLTLTLSDGQEVVLTREQLQGKTAAVLQHNIDRRGCYVDSAASIKKVAAEYAAVPQGASFGVAASRKKNGYRIESERVADGDVLHFTANVAGSGFELSDLNLCDVYIKGFDQGARMGVSKDQKSGSAGDINAGTMTYQMVDSASNRVQPNLQHPVAYIQVPTSTVVSDLSAVQVKEGAASDSNGKALAPHAVSQIKIGAINFIKVDLSNYDLLPRGFNITVPYDNALDAVPGSQHSPFLVVANNLSAAGYKGITHFGSQNNVAMKNLLTQEGIAADKTAYVGDGATWIISQGKGLTSLTLVGDNQSLGPRAEGTQSVDKPNPENFNIYGSIINATSQEIKGAVEVVNVPNKDDTKSEFSPVLAGPATLTVLNGTGVDDSLANSAQLLYSRELQDLSNTKASFNPASDSWRTASRVADWSQVHAVAVNLMGKKIPPYTALRLEIPLKDSDIKNHVRKSIYVASAIFSKNTSSAARAFFVMAAASGDEAELPTLTILPGSRNSAKLTVVGTGKPEKPAEPEEQTVTISYIDDTKQTDLSSYNKTIKGKPGTPLNYSTAETIKELAGKGYTLVSDNFDVTTMPAKGGHYEVHFTKTTTPPTEPGKPEQPGDKPEQPEDKPGKPEQPGKPDVPAERPDEQPDRPHRPGQAGDEPLRPDRPAQPGQLAEPTATPVAEEQKLPQTGSKDGRSALAAGFIGLAGMLSLLGFKKRKKN